MAGPAMPRREKDEGAVDGWHIEHGQRARFRKRRRAHARSMSRSVTTSVSSFRCSGARRCWLARWSSVDAPGETYAYEPSVATMQTTATYTAHPVTGTLDRSQEPPGLGVATAIVLRAAADACWQGRGPARPKIPCPGLNLAGAARVAWRPHCHCAALRLTAPNVRGAVPAMPCHAIHASSWPNNYHCQSARLPLLSLFLFSRSTSPRHLFRDFLFFSSSSKLLTHDS